MQSSETNVSSFTTKVNFYKVFAARTGLYLCHSRPDSAPAVTIALLSNRKIIGFRGIFVLNSKPYLSPQLPNLTRPEPNLNPTWDSNFLFDPIRNFDLGSGWVCRPPLRAKHFSRTYAFGIDTTPSLTIGTKNLTVLAEGFGYRAYIKVDITVDQLTNFFTWFHRSGDSFGYSVTSRVENDRHEL